MYRVVNVSCLTLVIRNSTTLATRPPIPLNREIYTTNICQHFVLTFLHLFLNMQTQVEDIYCQCALSTTFIIHPGQGQHVYKVLDFIECYNVTLIFLSDSLYLPVVLLNFFLQRFNKRRIFPNSDTINTRKRHVPSK